MSKKVISRLRRIARLEDLGERNMNSNALNIILQEKDEGVTVSSPVYRRLMNENTRYIVEIWELNNSKYAVFSGHYYGEWTPDKVDFHGIFDNEPEAEIYVQENLQGEAESKENLLNPEENNSDQEDRYKKPAEASVKKKDLRKHLS